MIRRLDGFSLLQLIALFTIAVIFAATSSVSSTTAKLIGHISPSSRLALFAKELKMLFPNTERVNRGNAIIK